MAENHKRRPHGKSSSTSTKSARRARPHREELTGQSSDRTARARAAAALARARRKGWSLERASHDVGTTPRTARKYFPRQWQKKGGHWVPTKADREPRSMLLLTTRGYIPIVVRGSKKASELGRYNYAVTQFLRGKAHDPSWLAEFAGKSIAGHPYLTDPHAVFQLGHAGVPQDSGLGSDQTQLRSAV
jgi:hypothetical protein